MRIPEAAASVTRVDQRVARGWLHSRAAFGVLLMLASCRCTEPPPAPGEAAALRLAPAQQLRQAGRLAEAAELLQPLTRDAALPVRAAATSLLARVQRDRDQPEEAALLLRAALELQQRLGNTEAVTDDASALLHVLIVQLQRLDEGAALLGELPARIGGTPRGVARLAYYRAVLAQSRGDLRSALRAAEEARHRWDALGNSTEHRFALELQAFILQALGRQAEAEALGRQLVESIRQDADLRADPCSASDRWTNAGWVLLLGQEDRPGEPAAGASLTATLEEALRLARRCGARQGAGTVREANALLNLALDALHRRHLDHAGELLDQARRRMAQPEPEMELWRLDLQARLGLARGDAAAALREYERLTLLAERAADPAMRWRAALGRALALEAQGQPALARPAYQRAEALLDDQLPLIGLGDGRGSFLASREQGPRRHLALLLELGRAEEAQDLTRRNRIRLLRHLSLGERLAELPAAALHRWDQALGRYRRQRALTTQDLTRDWERSAEELEQAQVRRQRQEAEALRELDGAFELLAGYGPPPGTLPLRRPAPGELLLIYAPLPRGWVGLAVTPRDTAVRRSESFPAPRGPAQAETLLGPFQPQLQAASRVAILAGGPLRWVDFHALPWQDGVLAEQLPVVYPLDLPWTAPDDPPGGGTTATSAAVALVVSDPESDLPESAAEGERVARQLEQSRRWTVRRLTGPQATAAALQVALPDVALFHFAGHGVVGGQEGWQSSLRLAGGSRFTVGDILALPRVPRQVVLSACEAGQSPAGEPVEGMGLAQAFLVRGSAEVVAAPRALGDRLARELASSLYAPEALALPDLAARLRMAQQQARAADPRGDWAAFRVLVR